MVNQRERKAKRAPRIARLRPAIPRCGTVSAMSVFGMTSDRYPIPGVPVWQNEERMGGTPCFDHTRVPVASLFEHLEGGISLDEFLDAFEGVTREQAVAVLEHAKETIVRAAA